MLILCQFMSKWSKKILKFFKVYVNFMLTSTTLLTIVRRVKASDLQFRSYHFLSYIYIGVKVRKDRNSGSKALRCQNKK